MSNSKPIFQRHFLGFSYLGLPNGSEALSARYADLPPCYSKLWLDRGWCCLFLEGIVHIINLCRLPGFCILNPRSFVGFASDFWKPINSSHLIWFQQPDPVQFVKNLFLPGGFELARYSDSRVGYFDSFCFMLFWMFYSVMWRLPPESTAVSL